ncbi:MAG: four-carbon acid sugar kinase family protein [Terracidiphilus sp.]
MRIATASSVPSQTPFAARFRSRIYLFADDLTGATDAAAAFLSAGHSVRVWTGVMASTTASESVQAFNTASRRLAPEAAALAVFRAATGLSRESDALFFKKIDSAARGPLAAELLAAQRALGAQAVILAPSFPAAGRTVNNGILEIQDVSGQLTRHELASLFPIETRHLHASISRPDQLASALASGKSILLCDAVTQADLEALAQAAANLPGLLYAGSAGLAQAIASLDPACELLQPFPASARTLVVAGTPHPVTKLQLDHLAAGHPAAQVLRVRFEAGDDALIRNQFNRYDPQALILTGGDTALLAARALNAHSFILHGEFAPGIPWGIVEGGRAQGRIVITKSGGFGTPITLNRILDTLAGQA